VRTVLLRINGQDVSASVGEGEPLLHVLRNRLDLKGTRFGCGEEACGACMVLVDGQPAFSCTAQAADLGGRSIETVEGLDQSATGRRLVEAFITEQAGQCGYCLSGMLMSAKALLEQTSGPSKADILAALEPHLCRCGSHHRIVRAVQRAAGR
jgi:nicotinate dehydrogenase subunit A